MRRLEFHRLEFSDLITQRHKPYVRYLLKRSQFSGSSIESEDFWASQGTEIVKPATIPDSFPLRPR